MIWCHVIPFPLPPHPPPHPPPPPHPTTHHPPPPPPPHPTTTPPLPPPHHSPPPPPHHSPPSPPHPHPHPHPTTHRICASVNRASIGIQENVIENIVCEIIGGHFVQVEISQIHPDSEYFLKTYSGVLWFTLHCFTTFSKKNDKIACSPLV